MGNVDAYAELVRRHRRRIYRIALRMLGSPDDADDVTQDVLLSLWTSLGSFSGNSRFTTWLYRVVVNRCIDSLEKRSRRSDEPKPRADTTPGADAYVEARGHARAALRAVMALPPDQRAVVVLIDIEEMRYREVASILNVSEATVRGRLYRACRRLLEDLREWK